MSRWNLYTDAAKQAVFEAQCAAEARGYDEVQPEHLLVGVLTADDNLVARVLKSQECDLGDILAALHERLSTGPGRTSAEMRLSLASKTTVDMAWQESTMLGDEHVGTEHLLLGILRAAESRGSLRARSFNKAPHPLELAASILTGHRLTAYRIRAAIPATRGDMLLRPAEKTSENIRLLQPTGPAPASDPASLLRASEPASSTPDPGAEP